MNTPVRSPQRIRVPTPTTMFDTPNDIHRTSTDDAWSRRHEQILKIWAEESLCWQKMHELANAKFMQLNVWLTLPVIIMSTLTGATNFALGSLEEPWKSRVPVMVGTLNILSGMITTVSQYLSPNERSEGHRAAAIAYGKMVRTVASEMALPPSERASDGRALMSKCRMEMDRLEEHSPEIPDTVLSQFFIKYSENIKAERIALPSNAKLRSVVVYTPDDADLELRVTTPVSAASMLNLFRPNSRGRTSVDVPVLLERVSERRGELVRDRAERAPPDESDNV